ncbi:MAG: PDZ domain-containing protein [Candidatus Acidiferrales bacterium]
MRGWLLVVGSLLLVGAVAVVLASPAGGGASEKAPRARPRGMAWAMAFDGHSRLGVSIGDVTAEKAKELKLPGEYGALIEEVEEDSPAAKGGLEANDVILSFDGERVRSAEHLGRLVRETPPGRAMSVQVSRGGQTRTVTVTPEKRSRRIEMPEINIPKIEVGPLPDFNFELFQRGPQLGISADELTPQLAEYFGVKQGNGVLVREVMTASAAEKAGLKAGDVIIRIDDEGISDVGDLRRALRRSREGRQATLTIVRNRSEQTVKVELEEPERPARRGVAGETGYQYYFGDNDEDITAAVAEAEEAQVQALQEMLEAQQEQRRAQEEQCEQHRQLIEQEMQQREEELRQQIEQKEMRMHQRFEQKLRRVEPVRTVSEII